jgi:hypothetical protein|tara:strand:- start:274 stop:588 length:315 start_codon:yes stop_codon:yes gene_type:complete
MKILELEIGEFYIINPNTKKQVLTNKNNLKLVSSSIIQKDSIIYKKFLYVYVGAKKERVDKKRLDSKKIVSYNYKRHTMFCVETGEKFIVSSYDIQTHFIKPKK